MNSRHHSAELIRNLAYEYGCPFEDVLLIFLNLLGIASSFGGRRVRFELTLDSAPQTKWHLIVPTGRTDSPFTVAEGSLFLSGDHIGRMTVVEHDDARLGYSRDEGKVLTLNSNRRSSCTGCSFCPNTLADANDPQVEVRAELREWLRWFATENGWSDLRGLREVNVSTGCFGEEGRALEHLSQLRATLTSLKFQGRLGFLSSVIRSDRGLHELGKLGPFCLFITLECLTNRRLMLKDSKASLSPESALEILSRARQLGIDTGVMIVIGLDELSEVERWLEAALPFLTDFPNLQILQSHNEFMDVFRAHGAQDLTFFLRARKRLERLIQPTPLRPRAFQNYRPLWYYAFGNEALLS